MLADNKSRRVAIVGYNRIPFARSNTAYATAGNKDMMTAALDGLIKRYGLDGQLIGEVACGAVIKHSREINLTRECVLSTSLDPRTPACDIQQACDTGIETAVYIANKIALGQIEAGISGGIGCCCFLRQQEFCLAAAYGWRSHGNYGLFSGWYTHPLLCGWAGAVLPARTFPLETFYMAWRH